MTTEQEKLVNQLLEKYLAGKCTPAEEAMVDEWYHQLTAGEENLLEKDRAFAAQAERQLRNQLPGLPAQVIPAATRMQPLRRVTAIAAAITGILLVYSGYLVWKGSMRKQAAAITAMNTGRRELKKVVLPDSSVVWLNEFSSLEWDENFNDTERGVKLSGEARFAVAQHAGRPFRVQAGTTTTTVLGTEFNIEAYKDEQAIKVALLSGKVRFEENSLQHQPVVLLPGHMVTYTKATAHSEVNSIGNAAVDAWVEGAMVFNEVPVEEAIIRLARHFDWTVQWKQKLAAGDGTTVTALFRRETPEQILQGIALTNQIRYRLKDKQLTIYGTD
ncbi:ferric-dicitrate binding protein FerR (iron transport regulator) [Filimonas zeae]|uniref:FecR family protein n=1 Tax=Filimonas zeae TaxID=1737353 RepID=A0A917MYD2_9BACT|nr:FecR domain-containing protein [Filimonas zeae]MDR6339841.1 ferric-dicitrate binding protein FerR (iron transport regulator) [Filimonas zeae]GGH69906.1 hypothetical protein GCM10011379_27680 [Filimonas zeae]